MDGRGGCCIAKYAGGGVSYKMERLMLKFRPIAPKPATGGSVFGSSSSENNSNKTSSGETTYVKAGRGKRKYNTNGAKRSYGGGRKRVRASPEGIKLANSVRDESSGDHTVVTLPLLPTESITPTSRCAPPAPIWLSFNTAAENNNSRMKVNTHQQKQAAVGGTGVIGSLVMVECVTEMLVNDDGLGRTDEEWLRNLEQDTCPGFISDWRNRVTWTNSAYKKMVVGDEGNGAEVVVRVAMNDRVPVLCPAFTCRVRVQQTCTKVAKILPCDVWRLECGGFAWRLDVKAALSLGR